MEMHQLILAFEQDIALNLNSEVTMQNRTFSKRNVKNELVESAFGQMSN